MGDPTAARRARAERRSRIKELKDEIKLVNTEIAAIQARLRPPVRSTKQEERELDLKVAVWLIVVMVVWQIVVHAVYYGH